MDRAQRRKRRNLIQDVRSKIFYSVQAEYPGLDAGEIAEKTSERFLTELDRQLESPRQQIVEALLATFPWLETDDDDPVSGADTVDHLQSLYRALTND